MVIHVCELNLL